jgi:poly-beta-1,6-N-acetyl-D-glucosamine synthase
MNLDLIDVIFFFYMFVGLYMNLLLILIYFPNRKRIFSFPESKPEPVSIVMPCYNEGETVGRAIESLLGMDYPKDMMEIIVVDDKSSDNSAAIAREYEKKYKNVRVIVNERNSGGAAEPTNIGVKAAKFGYIAVTDADSFPDKDALRKMIGFLQEDKTVGAVTCAVLAKNSRTFMQKLQEIEYRVISFTRKLLDQIDAVYVTPGPFALYRKSVLREIGYFDPKNLTQDIEIVWRLRAHGYRAKMCLAAKVYSETPVKFRHWWKQRVRWSIGGTQTMYKYRSYVFKKGMLGLFIIPFFTVSLFLGMFGLGLFGYLMGRRFLVAYLSTRYSLEAQTAVLQFQDLTFAPSVLNFFGAALFFLGLAFTFFVLSNMKDDELRKAKPFNILVYVVVYLMIYPFISATALYKLARGKYSW